MKFIIDCHYLYVFMIHRDKPMAKSAMLLYEVKVRVQVSVHEY